VPDALADATEAYGHKTNQSVGVPAGQDNILVALSIAQPRERSLDEIEAAISGDAAQSWAKVVGHWHSLENGYMRINTRPLRAMPIE